MRKFPKAFQRRKSTANAFEDLENTTPAESSFKVFDRVEKGEKSSRSFDGGVKLAKPPLSGPGRTTNSGAAEENMFENLGNYRASGGSNSNTASTTDNSSRLSAASTTASSTDLASKGEDWRSPHDKPFTNIPKPPAPKSTSAFSLKNAGRSLSWGRNKPLTPSSPTTPKESNSKSKELPSLPPSDDSYGSRSRAVTASSYASTATPPKLEEKDLGLSLGGDFSDMFAGFGKRKSVVLASSGPDRVMSQSPEIAPPAPSHGSRFNSPNHLHIDKKKNIEASPYSWGSQDSHDGLMANRSPPLPSAPQYNPPPPPVPQHAPPRANSDIRMVGSTARQGASSADGLRRSSALAGRRMSTLEYVDSVDEDARLLRESVNANRKINSSSQNKVRDSWALPSSSTSHQLEDPATSSWRSGRSDNAPRSQERQLGEDSIFDSHIAASADLASRFEERSDTDTEVPLKRAEAPNKVMTPAQFERYKQDQERMRSFGGKAKEDEDEEEDNYDDDEDEAEKAKQLAKQRRKQEAHMSVYRQQMMKVTGEAPVGPRPGAIASQSSPNLLEPGRNEGEDEDEEVPLAILQAHGFPNKNKPPMRSAGSNPNLRASTMGGGALPVFARHLPQDPYYGAGLQRPMHRESMAFGGGAASVAGGPPRGPPGGLVGVIATEERSRAMRRGSPNTQGDYGPPMPMNHASATGSMYGGMPGNMGPPGMNPMMMGPGDHAQAQLTAQMQQFMQMQMQFMQMMSQGQGAPSLQSGPMPPQNEPQRPSSSHFLRPGTGTQSHQRAMTMMEGNAAPWMQPGGGFAPSIRVQGYTPSIAPSERSNVGMPGRYRPVSHMPPPSDNKSRLSTMSGGLPNWEVPKTVTPTIRPVQTSGNASDEDDEGGWAEMAKKREKKKSMWKSKRDTTNFKDMLNF